MVTKSWRYSVSKKAKPIVTLLSARSTQQAVFPSS